MTREQLIKFMQEQGYEDSIFFECPSYDTAILGISDGGQVCYSFSKMIEYLLENGSASVEDALDFMGYNTLRALPYISPKDKRPIVVYDDIR